MTIRSQDEDPDALLWNDGERPDRIVTAGPWTLSLRGAELADIRYADRPVLRSIRFIVRDHDWRTAENMIISSAADNAERLQLTVRSVFDEHAVLEWVADVELGSELTVAVRGRALQDFRRNRIGLIVLHAPELAGRPLQILHPGGGEQTAAFPSEIAPHQPALDVAGYRWRSDHVEAELQLTGDVFEMEDQRNWTDASYKTYSTPLDRPFPVPVTAGEVIEQSLRLSCRASGTAGQRPMPELIMPTAERLPMLQLGAGTAPERPPSGELSPTPILVEVPADERRWPAVLRRALRDAAGADLDVRIVAGAAEQIGPVVDALVGVPVSRIAVYDRASSRTTAPLYAALRHAAGAVLPGIEVLAGTRAHFTELNRTIDDVADHDGGLTFSITPQMHDRSRAQLIESLPIQRLVAEQAVRLAAGREVHIGPVTLRSRFNAVATTAFLPDDHAADDHDRLADGYGPQQVPESIDPRQSGPGVAAWTVCSIAALAVPGVSSLTFFEAWGPRGVRRAPGATPDPAGQVLEWIRAAGELEPLPPVTIIDGPAAAIGLLCQRLDGARQLLIGNPGDRPAVLQLAANPVAEQQLGDGVALSAVPGGCRLVLPAARAIKIILDR